MTWIMCYMIRTFSVHSVIETMAFFLYSPLFLLFLLTASCTTSEDAIGILIERFDRLEKIQRFEIENLKEEMTINTAEFKQKISELEERVKYLEERNNALVTENEKYKYIKEGEKKKIGDEQVQKHTEDVVDAVDEIRTNSMEESIQKHAKKRNKIMGKACVESNQGRRRRALLKEDNIAFSAYMDHDANNLGPDQKLIFNKILLNDGNGYNNYSGIFTAPIPGVYSFSFFIGERDMQGSYVALWVNNDNKIDAVVDAFHPTQDLQGGNTVNLKLNQGDIVYIKHIGGGHVEGSEGLRVTSFSGFLLYSIEISQVVGK